MAVNIDNYGLKYVWTGNDVHGIGVQLKIMQKELPESVSPRLIGSLTFINLDIQGSQNDVSTPIVKTSLSFGLVDAPDKSTSMTKCGGWEEFFTPDSTKYLVILSRQDPGSGWYEDWRGYITPDSWKESLDYHGEITIVARDGLGFLQNRDFEWVCDNIKGMAGISAIFNAYLQDIDFPMDWEYPFDNTGTKDASHLKSSSGTYLIDAGVFVSHFFGETVLEVLEALLESVGYCFRFVGKAKWVVVPLKNLPLFDMMAKSDVPVKQIEFYGGDRALDPAYRELIEKVSYEHEDEIELPREIAFNGSIVNYAGRYYEPGDGWKVFTGKERHGLTEKSWKKIMSWEGDGFFNGSQGVQRETLTNQEGADYLETSLLMSADRTNADTSRFFRLMVNSTEGEWSFELGRPVELKTASSPWEFARLKNYIYSAEIQVEYTDNKTGLRWYWNGANWVQHASTTHTMTIQIANDFKSAYELTFTLGDVSDDGGNLGGILRVYFLNWHTRGDDYPDNGSYVPIRKVEFSPVSKTVLKSDTVTTVNNSTYNAVKERKPKVAPLSVDVPYLNGYSYENALWDVDSYSRLIPFAYKVFWSNEASTKAIPVAGQIHKQLLCYNAEPLSILNGDCFLVDKSEPWHPYQILSYKGRQFIVQSCTYDVLEGRLTGAILHEFIWFDDLWDESQSVGLSVSTELQRTVMERALADALDISTEEAGTLIDSGESLTLTKEQLSKISLVAEENDVDVESTEIEKITVAPSQSLSAAIWEDVNENN